MTKQTTKRKPPRRRNKPDSTPKGTRRLQPRQRLFVDAYIANGMNATRAAKQAGYSARTAYSTGSRLLKVVEIQQAIQEQLSRFAMSKEEVLARLTAQARGTMEHFYDADAGMIDMMRARDAGVMHLVKKVTRTMGEDKETIAIELYDAQAALVQLGRYHKLFTEQHEIGGKAGAPLQTVNIQAGLGELTDDNVNRAAEILRILADARALEPGTGDADDTEVNAVHPAQAVD